MRSSVSLLLVLVFTHFNVFAINTEKVGNLDQAITIPQDIENPENTIICQLPDEAITIPQEIENQLSTVICHLSEQAHSGNNIICAHPEQAITEIENLGNTNDQDILEQENISDDQKQKSQKKSIFKTGVRVCKIAANTSCCAIAYTCAAAITLPVLILWSPFFIYGKIKDLDNINYLFNVVIGGVFFTSANMFLCHHDKL